MQNTTWSFVNKFHPDDFAHSIFLVMCLVGCRGLGHVLFILWNSVHHTDDGGKLVRHCFMCACILWGSLLPCYVCVSDNSVRHSVV